MAVCRSLQHILDKSLPENPTFFKPLSTWSSITEMEPIVSTSFTELFGEMHFQENHHGESDAHPLSSDSPSSCVSSSSSSCSESNNNHQLIGFDMLCKENNALFSPCYSPKKQYMHGHSFSSMSSEGSDQVEEFGNENVIEEQSEYMYCDHKRLVVNRGAFPPPISCIGSTGKPFVNFKSYKENGRFILYEVMIPQHQCLRAIRENGRLKLQFIHSDDTMYEEYDEEEIVDGEDFDLGGIKEEKGEELQESNVDDPINNENEEN